MSKLDIQRLRAAKEVNTVRLNAGVTRRFQGCSEGALRVMVNQPDKPAILYSMLPVGYFDLSITAPWDMDVTFMTEPKKSLSMIGEVQETVIVGEPDNSWTTVGHRPAINPQIAAIQRELALRDLQHVREMAEVRAQAESEVRRRLEAEAAAAAAAAAATVPPSSEPVAE